MLNLIKPYRTHLIDTTGKSQCLYSWTLKDALEWATCSLRSDSVKVFKYRKIVAIRSTTEEI